MLNKSCKCNVCSYSNYFIIKTIHYYIAASSVFTIHPQHQFIHNKDNAVFECVANGSESLKITWIKNTKQIANSHFNEVSYRSVLKVNEATVNDSGVYQCIATNVDNETVYSQPAELLSKIKKYRVV